MAIRRDEPGGARPKVCKWRNCAVSLLALWKLDHLRTSNRAHAPTSDTRDVATWSLMGQCVKSSNTPVAAGLSLFNEYGSGCEVL